MTEKGNWIIGKEKWTSLEKIIVKEAEKEIKNEDIFFYN